MVSTVFMGFLDGSVRDSVDERCEERRGSGAAEPGALAAPREERDAHGGDPQRNRDDEADGGAHVLGEREKARERRAREGGDGQGAGDRREHPKRRVEARRGDPSAHESPPIAAKTVSAAAASSAAPQSKRGATGPSSVTVVPRTMRPTSTTRTAAVSDSSPCHVPPATRIATKAGVRAARVRPGASSSASRARPRTRAVPYNTATATKSNERALASIMDQLPSRALCSARASVRPGAIDASW